MSIESWIKGFFSDSKNQGTKDEPQAPISKSWEDRRQEISDMAAVVRAESRLKAVQDGMGVDSEYQKRRSIADAYISGVNERSADEDERVKQQFIGWVATEFNLSLEEATDLVDRSTARGKEKEDLSSELHHKKVNKLFSSDKEKNDAYLEYRQKYSHNHPCGAAGTMGYNAAMDRKIKIWIEDGYICVNWLD